MRVSPGRLAAGRSGIAPGEGISWWCRERLRRRLASIAGGVLEVEDPWGIWRAGTDDEDGRPPSHVRLRVRSPRAYRDILSGGGVGAARAYMEGQWDCDDLTALFSLLLRNPRHLDGMETGLAAVSGAFERLRRRLNGNGRAGSRRNARAHYDLGNAFFALFLDETMTYSSGIFAAPARDLREASIEKLDRICRKLALGPRDHVVEIGCGWGSFAIHAASRYGCRVTAATLSRGQLEEARRRVAARGLGDRVQIVLRDYRDLHGAFDKLVSIEMIEAVGHERLPGFFEKCASLLRPDGAMLLQAITMPDRRYHRYLRSSDFIRAFVFPGSCVPSLCAMQAAFNRATDFRLVHLEDFGPHYARTLRAWRDAFEARYGEARALGYSERFLRMWRYYLCYCEAGFTRRYTGVVQMLLDRPERRAPPVLGEIPHGARPGAGDVVAGPWIAPSHGRPPGSPDTPDAPDAPGDTRPGAALSADSPGDRRR